MRTTVSLDPDLAAKLRRIARERDISFKEALNSALRVGLGSKRHASQLYRLPTRRLDLRRGIDLTRALALAAELEDAETVRKLELRK